MIKILPSNQDPVLRFFEGIDPAHIVLNPDYEPPAAIEGAAISHRPVVDEPEEIFGAELVEDRPSDAVNGDDTPTRIRQMIQDDVFDPHQQQRS